MMLQVLDFKIGLEDPATQNAVDWMGESAGMSRKQLLDFLKRQFESDADHDLFVSSLMSAWTNNRKMKLATGRSRDEWLALL